jgi:hypothetical protein
MFTFLLVKKKRPCRGNLSLPEMGTGARSRMYRTRRSGHQFDDEALFEADDLEKDLPGSTQRTGSIPDLLLREVVAGGRQDLLINAGAASCNRRKLTAFYSPASRQGRCASLQHTTLRIRHGSFWRPSPSSSRVTRSTSARGPLSKAVWNMPGATARSTSSTSMRRSTQLPADPGFAGAAAAWRS